MTNSNSVEAPGCVVITVSFILIVSLLIYFKVGPADIYKKFFGGDKYQKWEYKLAPLNPIKNVADFEIQKTILDGFGEQGWEYAGLINDPALPYVILKQPKRPVSK